MGESNNFYEVIVTASVQMLVQAESEDQAGMLAWEEVDFDYAGVKEITSPRLIENEDEVDQLERLEDQTIYI